MNDATVEPLLRRSISMAETLVIFIVAVAIFGGIRRAVERGVRDAHRRAEPPPTRRGMGWHNDQDKRAR